MHQPIFSDRSVLEGYWTSARPPPTHPGASWRVFSSPAAEPLKTSTTRSFSPSPSLSSARRSPLAFTGRRRGCLHRTRSKTNTSLSIAVTAAAPSPTPATQRGAPLRGGRDSADEILGLWNPSENRQPPDRRFLKRLERIEKLPQTQEASASHHYRRLFEWRLSPFRFGLRVRAARVFKNARQNDKITRHGRNVWRP